MRRHTFIGDVIKYHFSICWPEDFERRSRWLFPDGIPIHFLRKFQQIAHSHRRTFKNINEELLYFHRAGIPEETIIEVGRASLDAENFDKLRRRLGRQMSVRKKSPPDVDVLICYLHDDGVLTDCSAEEGAKCVTKWLRDVGAKGISKTAYQKRLERLIRLGVIDKN